MTDVHLRELRYFVAVAEELSFTRAAGERLFIAQPTLSKQIRQLERDLRVELFERGARTVALTPAGATLLPLAKQLIEDWARARRATTAATGDTLTVGFQTRIGRGLIPQVSERMAELLPGWRLNFRQISWADPTAGLADGTVDVAIAWLPLPDPDLTWCVVATEPRWVALPAVHPLTRHAVVPFESLLDEPFIALPRSAGAARDFWLACDQRDRPAVVGAEATSADETFEAVASGLGVVLVSSGNAESYRRDDVAARPVSGLTPSELAVAWRAGDEREAVRVFTKACARCLCHLNA
ncbi:LysR family transcriptional regulator [Pseudonocardia spinosispora]|uniref:LysR family transcriptional regulator n=1 Tax=Pseudonocardia spinosispora TaxID=103441 RepID=UPI00042117A8|nr:LysR family transcriptional regulator [Pseudonocardia spinosispora]